MKKRIKIILVEKYKVGEKIANILFTQILIENIKSQKIFVVDKDIYIFPLSGHFLNRQYEEKYYKWSSIDPLELISKTIIEEYKNSVFKLTLKKFIDQFSEIDLILATDNDSEGELIAMDFYNSIRLLKSDLKIYPKRMVINSITRSEVIKGYNNLIPINFINAIKCETRHKIDLIIGVILTRFFSLTLKKFGKNYISIGRVRTPLLNIILENSVKILKFVEKIEYSMVIKTNFLNFKNSKIFEDKDILSDYIKTLFISEEMIKKGLKTTIKLKKVLPPIPLDTTSFLKLGTSKGFSAYNTMKIAEKLYLDGFITYPRTDNQRYMDIPFLKEIKNSFVEKGYGYYFKDIDLDSIIIRGKLEKDHLPIMPTGKILRPEFYITDQYLKIYTLILNYFLNTLKQSTQYEHKKITFNLSSNDGLENIFNSEYFLMKKEGWKKINTIDHVKYLDLSGLKLEIYEDIKKPPKKYKEVDLISVMDKNKIGTKSTRHNIIGEILNKKYIEKDKNGHISITIKGFKIIKLILKFIDELAYCEFTNNLKEKLKTITDISVQELLINQYKEFLKEKLDVMYSKKLEIYNYWNGKR